MYEGKFDEMRREQQDAVLAMGPPLFVPSDQMGLDWKVSGWGQAGDRQATTRASVHGKQGSRFVEVETNTDFRAHPAGLPDRFLVHPLLVHSVPDELAFPFSLTVRKRTSKVKVEGLGHVELVIVETARVWRGFGDVGERWVMVTAREIAPEKLVLAQIADLLTLSADRWV